MTSAGWGLWVGAWLAAHAGNEDELPLGAEASLTGAAVTATVRSGAALAYNPAGLAVGDSTSVDATVQGYGLRRYVAPDYLVTADGRSADASVVEAILVPVAASYVRRLSPSIRGGAGVFVERWSDTVLRTSIVDEPPVGLLVLAERFQRVQAIAGIGATPVANLDLGVAVSGSYTGRSSALQFVEGDVDNRLGLSSIESSTGIGVGVRAGLQWTFAEDWTVGLSTILPGLRVITITTTDTTTDVTTPDARAFDVTSEASTRLGGGLELPFRARLGLARTIRGDGWIALDADVHTPLRNADLGVDRRWLVNVRLGARMPTAGPLDLGWGLFTDRAAGRQGELDFYGVTGGVHLREELRLAAGDPRERVAFDTTVGFRFAAASGPVATFALMPRPVPTIAESTSRLSVFEAAIFVSTGLRIGSQ